MFDWLRFGTFNPFELFAMLATWTRMQSMPDKDASALVCVDCHITNYNGMAGRARCKYVFCKVVQLVAGGLVPLFATLGDEWRVATGILGVVAVFAGGIDTIGQYRESWVRWRRAWQQLMILRQGYLYRAEKVFEGMKRDAELMKRVNRVLNDEYDDWHSSSNTQPGPAQPKTK